MTVIETRATVDASGNVTVSVGRGSAGTQAVVTVRPSEWSGPTQERWLAALDGLAGVIDDPSFVRPPQPPLDQRESLD